MDAEAKERLIDEFRACLNDFQPVCVVADAAQPVPDAQPSQEAPEDEPPVNLSLLFTELAVLRNEVRVQARQFKTALDEMRALTELLGEQNRHLTHDLERAREAQGATLRQAETQLLLELLDVRDRIAAAVGVSDAYRPGFLARFASKETQLAQGLSKGIALTLQRVDDLLAQRRVRALDVVGGRLDPHTMRAVGVKWRAQRAPGEVLSEVRRGYLRDNDLLRLAEVIVNKQEIEP
jgi:molecular chaperone GrpE